MDRSSRAARAAHLVAVATVLLAGSSIAQAQRSHPRAEPPAQPRPPRIGTYNPQPPADPRYDGRNGGYPRDHDAPFMSGRQRWGGSQYGRGPNIIVVPVPSEYGYGYGYGQYGYYPYGYGGVNDVNGRPLATGYLSDPPVERFSYTPDLSGSPYRVAENGMMLVDFENGDRRGFPSCASQHAAHDPQGRPRTLFYQAPEYELVLGPGQRGRVLGAPPAGAAACYGLDSNGHVVLRY